MTSDEEFASCERSDRLFGAVLGPDLEQATLRLVAIVLVICAILAAVPMM